MLLADFLYNTYRARHIITYHAKRYLLDVPINTMATRAKKNTSPHIKIPNAFLMMITVS